MVPNLMSAYGVTAGGLAAMSAAYYYIYTPMQLPVGILMDRYGPRRLLSLAVLMCAVGALVMAGILSLPAATIARLLMGFGSAFAFVGVMKLAAHWLPPARLAMISGISTTLGMVGAIVGDTALNSLVYNVGWRESWFIAGIVGLILALVMWLVIRDNPQHKRLAPGMKRETRTWGQAWKYLLSIAKNFQFWVNGLIGGLLFLPLTVFGALWGVPFLEQAYGIPHQAAGEAISMLFIGVAVSGPILGWLSSYIKRRKIVLMVGSLGATICFGILLYSPQLSIVSINVLLFLIGAFVAAEILVFAIGCEISSPKAAGTAVAGTNFLVMIGGAIFQPVAGWLLDLYWTHHLVNGVRHYSYHDFQIALTVLPVGLLVAFGLTLILKETHCKQQFVDLHHRHPQENSFKTKKTAHIQGDMDEPEFTTNS